MVTIYPKVERVESVDSNYFTRKCVLNDTSNIVNFFKKKKKRREEKILKTKKKIQVLNKTQPMCLLC